MNISEQDWINAVSNNGGLLYQVKEQTEKICLAAVRENPWVIQAVINKTHLICLAAVQGSGLAVEFIEEELQTPELVLVCVQQNGLALGLIRKDLKSFSVCLAAVQQNGLALQYVDEDCFTPSEIESLCIEAVTQNCEALTLIGGAYQTVNVCFAAINGNTGTVLDKIEYHDPAISLKAVSNNSRNLQFIKNPTNMMYLASVKQYLRENNFEDSPRSLMLEMFNDYSEIECVDEISKEKEFLRSNKSVIDCVKNKYPMISVVTLDKDNINNTLESFLVEQDEQNEGLYLFQRNETSFEIYKKEKKTDVHKGWFTSYKSDNVSVIKIESWNLILFKNLVL